MNKNIAKILSFCVFVASVVWIVLGILLIRNTVNVFRDYNRVEKAQVQYFDFSDAAELLRKGSDTLTECSRLFAITHDERYLREFFHEKFIDCHREHAIDILANNSEATELKRLIIEAVSASRTLEYTEYRSINLVLEAIGHDRSSLPDNIQKQLASPPLSNTDRALSKEQKLQLAQNLLFDYEYQTQKKKIWGTVEQFMEQTIEQAKRQSLSVSDDIARKYRLQTIYLAVLTFILLALLAYAFVVNRLRLKYSHKLEEANDHLLHEAELVAHESEMKLRQARLEAERDSAIKAEKAKSYFFATVSHDIRTPLNSIIGFTELLCKDYGTPEMKKQYLDSIAFSGKMLMELINDILDLSKLEADKMQFNYDYHDFPELINSLIMVFKNQTDQKGLKLIANIDKMPLIRIDLQRVRQIAFNLIGNAIKFTAKGSITITASCTDNGHGLKNLIFSVTDTGVGIAAEDVKKLMEPYVQLRTKSSVKGTGLGLAICKQLLSKMNGNLTIASTPGEGTTFTVTMNDLESTNNVVKKAEKPTATLKGDFHNLNLLLVDDTTVNLSMLKAMCASIGIEGIKTAANGRQALDVLKDGQVDVILTDLQMPEIDGVQLVQEVHKLPQFANLPIYAVTGDVEILKTYQQDGFTGLLLKPIDLAKLTDLLNECIQRKHQRNNHDENRH
ncbi:MAG: response regulator [Victivallales bacterium]|nr:response regulator [Victivallales bacterium]